MLVCGSNSEGLTLQKTEDKEVVILPTKFSAFFPDLTHSSKTSGAEIERGPVSEPGSVSTHGDVLLFAL